MQKKKETTARKSKNNKKRRMSVWDREIENKMTSNLLFDTIAT